MKIRFTLRTDRSSAAHDTVTLFANGGNCGSLVLRVEEATALRERISCELVSAPLLPTSSGAGGLLAFLQGFIAQTGERGATLEPAALVGLGKQIADFLELDRKQRFNG